MELGRLARLPDHLGPSPPLVQISPLGAIPKKHKPDKWRLIVDLSSPHGCSINDAIPKDLCSVSYDQAVVIVRSLGKGCLLTKLDLKEAYRVVSVHSSDQRLLAVQWKGSTYIDKTLPFGLRSAPNLFSALTDAMMRFLHKQAVESALHYLDDFLLLGPPGSPGYHRALSITVALCTELGFPVSPKKTEGPTTSLIFLGIEMDTVGQLRLPGEKQEHLLAQWMNRVACPTSRGSAKKCALLSLLGLLNYVAVAVRPGRPFLHSLFRAAATVQDVDHWVH